MRFYISVLYTYLLLSFKWSESKGTRKRLLDEHYKRQQNRSDKKSHSYEERGALYSKMSKSYVQIQKRLVNAKASANNGNADLVLETSSFGIVRIRSFKSNYYICINKNGFIIGLNKTNRQKKRCIFNLKQTADGFSYFRSLKYENWSLGFTKQGDAKPAKKTFISTVREGGKHVVIKPMKFLIEKRDKVKQSSRPHSKRNVRYIITDRSQLRRQKRHKEKVKECSRSTLCIEKAKKLKKKLKNIGHVLTKCIRTYNSGMCSLLRRTGSGAS